jgi:phospholipid/cholesterol/gamma-HCH transport system substrate-binding protein
VSRRLLAVVVGFGLLAAATGCTLPGQVSGPVQLTATFSDVGDLVVGHSVQVADVRVGSVTKIQLTDGFQARVTMRIKDHLHLPADAAAYLRTTSLLGEKFIELRPPQGSPKRPPKELVDGAVIPVTHTHEAPELEFVADDAVQVLAGVAGSDVADLVNTGGIGFEGRATELAQLIDSLSTVTGTLAGQTDDIVAIIDGLDRATSTLAANDTDVDHLLVNLATTTTNLSKDRELTLQTLRDLTRLAKAQNDEVFGPYKAKVEAQVQQLDAILQLVAARRGEVATLVDWLRNFSTTIPKGIPGDFAQVYGWFVVGPVELGK